MKRKTIVNVIVIALLVVAFAVMSVFITNPEVTEGSRYYATFMALVPPLIAIILALVTKEVFSSLFVGILAGALLYTNFQPVATLDTIVNDGFIGSLSDAGNVGIIIFLVILGAMVALINKAGGSAAFGEWAKKNIKSRVGAQLATFLLGVLIFVDDYFNCLTVGSVMKPVTDSKNISRAKLAYLIDATAAPVCMIAPVSSWAAAVAGVVVGVNGISLFIQTIPYNFYSLLTLVMIIAITVMKVDFGPMKKHEENALKGDLFTEGDRPEEGGVTHTVNSKGKVIDIILPVIALIVCCIVGMIYTGGFFGGESFIDAFANCDATVGLPWGSIIALILTVIYMLCRGVLSFKETMESLTKGFIAMVPPILILSFAWTLNGLTSSLGGDVFVYNVMSGTAEGFAMFLPAIIFVVAVILSFSTGTSWGTFGILIPIVVNLFTNTDGSVEMTPLLIIGISACLAGAVCGDHCSPISDTTIMASAGANCNHLNHVSTQLPYAIFVAAISFFSFILAGIVQKWYIVLPISIVVMLAILAVIKMRQTRKAAK